MEPDGRLFLGLFAPVRELSASWLAWTGLAARLARVAALIGVLYVHYTYRALCH